MDLNKNYYLILGVPIDSEPNQIKKAYYKLSFTHHPDKGGDALVFGEMTEAYDVLTSELKELYDLRSKWGKDYDESLEFLNFEFDSIKKGWNEEKFTEWKKQNQLNIIHYLEDDFKGNITIERWVICKTCGGDGKDTESKIEIRDESGKLLKLFEGSDGCDFCEGTGLNWNKQACYFCGGKGKVGWVDCKTCKGEKRILGKQKIKGIKFPKDEKVHIVEKMGHYSQTDPSKCGDLVLIKK